MFRILLTAATACLTLAPGAPGAGAEPFRLIVTHLETPLAPNSVLDLALQEGYFARAGVEVELIRVQQTPSALAALRSGAGEMANVGTDALIRMAAQGADLKAVDSPNKSLPFLIAARREIATLADLAGGSFGVGRLGSVDHGQSLKVLEAQGLDPETLQVVSLGQPGVRAQALMAGAVDATTMSIGVLTTLPDRTGIHVLVDPETYYAAAPVVSKLDVVRGDVLRARAAEVSAVVEALVLASRAYAADPAAWVAAMEKARPDVARADLEALAAAYAGSWSVNGGLSAKELRYTSDWLHESEDFATTPKLEIGDWVDFSVLDGVLARLGVVEGADEPTR
ncbi:ABC transporter substrate-binding protein [Neomegalonema sp.]|uniref:ABC transporter substrate-binding protein n=1 Tax=Neomegalonema sp. TaxID=2039713 RepID=UPI002630C42D|nr:ABC transporter substrate-binding protein [Neomegalonema sp.]MDD2869266.1 ABC transporter substrate-binding protein [Neomegalonema sp.]